MFRSVSELFFKKIREQKFENTPFSFGDETYGDANIRERRFEHASSFSDETYGDVETSGYNVHGRIVRGRNLR